MAGYRVLRCPVRCFSKFQASFFTVRCNHHFKTVETVEELENVYAERKRFINGKFKWEIISIVCCYCFIS